MDGMKKKKKKICMRRTDGRIDEMYKQMMEQGIYGLGSFLFFGFGVFVIFFSRAFLDRCSTNGRKSCT